MDRWYTGSELLAMWDLKPYEWLEAITVGSLTPYSEDGQKISFVGLGEPRSSAAQQQYSLLEEQLAGLESHLSQLSPDDLFDEADKALESKKAKILTQMADLEAKGIRSAMLESSELQSLPETNSDEFKEAIKGFNFKRQDVETFAKGYGLSIADAPQVEGILQRIQDPTYPHYSSRLAAALTAYKFFYVEGGLKPRKSAKRQILEWLKSHYPHLSTSAREQIVGTILSDEHRKGGSPKSA